MLAAQPIAAGDGALEVVLGLGVAVTFAGLLLRAVRRLSRSRLSAAVTARLDAAARQTAAAATAGAPASPRTDEVRQLEAPMRALVELAEICEPEARRLSDECLAPVARTLDSSRRLLAAEERVAAALAELPVSFWLVERNVLIGSRRIPFLALGATGVFALCPSDGAWTIDDLAVMSDVAGRVRRQLPGYTGPVLGAVCLAFDDLTPRTWFGGAPQQGRGGWLLGLEWLLPWMFSFGPQDGLRRGDVRRLDETSGPSLEPLSDGAPARRAPSAASAMDRTAPFAAGDSRSRAASACGMTCRVSVESGTRGAVRRHSQGPFTPAPGAREPAAFPHRRSGDGANTGRARPPASSGRGNLFARTIGVGGLSSRCPACLGSSPSAQRVARAERPLSMTRSAPPG